MVGFSVFADYSAASSHWIRQIREVHVSEGACGCRGGPRTADTWQRSLSLCSCSVLSFFLEPHGLFCQWLASVFHAFRCSNNPFNAPRGEQRRPLQIFWHMCRRDLVEEVASFHTLQERPLAQSQRWKISKPWEPFFLCLVHTSPCLSTGLQILVQKWRAQQ